MTGVRDAPDAGVAPRPADALAVDPAQAALLMTDMLIARRASERIWNLQRQGRLATVAPLTGQEAAVVGVVRALDLAHDWLAPYYRELLGIRRARRRLPGVGRSRTGAAHPDGGRITRGRPCPAAADLARHPGAARRRDRVGAPLRGEPGVACTFIGDGATSEGDFYEGLNLAGVQQVPAARSGAQQRMGDLHPHQPPDRGADVRRQGRGRRRAVRAGRRQRRARGARRGRPCSPACRLGGRAGAARARHLPHGRAHQLRRSQPLRAARGARSSGGRAIRSSSSAPRWTARASGRRATTEPRSTTVEARLERIIDAAIARPSRPGRRARPPVRDGESAARTSARGARRTNRCVAVRLRDATTGMRRRRCRGGHEHARRDPRHDRATRWRATTASMLLGEDVGRNGGVFRVTDGLLDRFGDTRVFDTPISESAIIGASVGPLRRRASCRSPRSSSPDSARRRTTRSSGQLSRLRYRSRGRFHCPVTIRMPYGGGVRTPEHHADSVEAPFAHAPGLKIVVPSTAADAKGLLASAVRDPDPVLVLEPIPLYRTVRDEVPEGEHLVELGTARVVREPGDAVVIAWGAMVDVACRGRRRARANGAARRSASSTSARSHRSTSRRSSASPSAPGASSWCTRRRSPRGSAPRSSPPSRRRRSSRSRRRSGGSRATTCPPPCRWSRTGADPTRRGVAAALEAALDA